MPPDDTPDQPLGFSIDIGKILRDGGIGAKKRTTRRKSTTSRSTSGDMDAAVRRAVRAEIADVERALRDLATEIVRLRRANEDLADKIAKLPRR
jgi:hypothetical protein